MRYRYVILFFVLFIFAIFVDAKKQTHFFQSWETSMQTCENMCYSSGQEWSRVKQYGAGMCTCDNKEGRKVTSAYRYCLNNPCNLEKYK